MKALTWALIAMGGLIAVLAIEWANSAIRFYRKFRGQRLITCPETHEHEVVEIAAVSGAMKEMFQPSLKLRTCTRWPERQDCRQFCLSQIEQAPAGCLVKNIVSNWYAGKHCAYCRVAFEALRWHEHPPALLDATGKTVLWPEVRLERLPDILASSKPVCWNCHIAETFRREHGATVTDRNFDSRRPAA